MGAEQRIVFRVHAIRRMFQRQISVDDVREALAAGQIIEEYPEDGPYPSRLVLGRTGNRPIHVVAAHNSEDEEVVVITAYEPDPTQWDREFKRRRT
jgi:Domain of unknown function (DUF4258)